MRPVDVLQDAARVVGHVDVEPLLHVRVPLLRDRRHVQFSSEEGALDAEDSDDMEAPAAAPVPRPAPVVDADGFTTVPTRRRGKMRTARVVEANAVSASVVVARPVRALDILAWLHGFASAAHRGAPQRSSCLLGTQVAGCLVAACLLATNHLQISKFARLVKIADEAALFMHK